MLNKANLSDIGKFLEKMHNIKIPVLVENKTNGSKRNCILLDKDIFNQILNQLEFRVNATKENTGDITLELKKLNLLAWGNTLDEAVDSLVNDIIIYAEEYKHNIDLYYKDPSRENHLVYLIKVWNSNGNNDVKKMLVLEDQS